MALNNYMHPRNLYKDRKPNFKELAVKYPEFRKHAIQDLKGNVHLDFKKPECNRALSWALLRDDFNLDIEMPIDRLIPTIPLRLNYILWIEDILGQDQSAVSGIDIGTGASCVYPLLGARKNSWSFVGTEVDSESFAYAQKNVEKNGLEDKVKVVKVDDKDMLYAVLKDSEDQFDFTMCNPPFFGSNLEAWGMLNTRKEDRPQPKTVNTASPVESIYPGGEVAYIKRMIEDSLELKEKVRVYTTMVGKKSSLSLLKAELDAKNISNYGTTEFYQGRTLRWGLGWSFDPNVLFPKSTRKAVKSDKPKPPLVFTIDKNLDHLPGVKYNIESLSKLLSSWIQDLKIIYEPEKMTNEVFEMTLLAQENTWTGMRKKRREQMRQQQAVNTQTNDMDQAGGSTSHQTQGPGQEDRDLNQSTKNRNQQRKRHLNDAECSGDLEPKKFKSDESSGKDLGTSAEKNDTNQQEKSQNRESTDFQDVSLEDVEKYLLKITFCLKKEKDLINLSLTWIDGEDFTLMNQLATYFRGKFSNKLTKFTDKKHKGRGKK